ncbi:hypothetical protein NPIL_393791 [Nephila pilipes]|uniref:Uncharacterized protein n=1 Tax=Nephila pilipes TaxID=299642 RepID=A0A8X6UES3_NEPPI|nr:hypothetical protein NPIL_393791 [Nephila pilipes]
METYIKLKTSRLNLAYILKVVFECECTVGGILSHPLKISPKRIKIRFNGLDVQEWLKGSSRLVLKLLRGSLPPHLLGKSNEAKDSGSRSGMIRGYQWKHGGYITLVSTLE